MDNAIVEQEVVTAAAPVEEISIAVAEEFTPEAGSAEYEELKAALQEAKIKLALLLCGVTKEKLDEGTTLAAGYCAAGLEPEEAAIRVTEAYPHLKLVSREVPKFAVQSSGSGDGFSAIRSIFAKR